jgi:hypothetical protein
MSLNLAKIWKNVTPDVRVKYEIMEAQDKRR